MATNAYVIMQEETYAQIVDIVRLKTGLSRDMVAGDLAVALQKIDIVGLPQFTARAILATVPYQAISLPICALSIQDDMHTVTAALTLNEV